MLGRGGHRTGSGQTMIQSPHESSQNTNTASTMKRNFLRREFMRNSTYGVIEAQDVSLLARIEVQLCISFLACCLNVSNHHIVVC